MKHLLSLFILLLTAPILNAQSEVSLEMQLLSPGVVGEAALDQDSFVEWIKSINEDLKSECAKIKGDKEVALLVTVHSDKDVSLKLYSRPKVSASALNSLRKKLEAHPTVRTKFNEFSLMVVAVVNNGAESEEFTPAIVLPIDQEMAEFKDLSLVDKQKDIQLWMRKDILPVLAHLESNVDPEYSGVLSIGNLLKEGEYLQEKTEKITDENSDYWRATMEMSKGNQLVPFTKACVLLANGEFDKAKRLLYVINFFYDESTLPAKLNEEITAKLNLYLEELGEEIEKGIAFHDTEKYAEAIDHYNDLLEKFPNSAWLNYELYYSKTAYSGDMDVDGKEWDAVQKTIYACDPMYPINARANSGKEGYLLFRRQEINGLFTSSEELRSDFVRYADIALDLESYGFAAQIYWLALSHLKSEDYDDRDILAHFLYCLDKLGDKETIGNFSEDYSEKFEKIEAERLKLMKNSIMYQAFEKDE